MLFCANSFSFIYVLPLHSRTLLIQRICWYLVPPLLLLGITICLQMSRQHDIHIANSLSERIWIWNVNTKSTVIIIIIIIYLSNYNMPRIIIIIVRLFLTHRSTTKTLQGRAQPYGWRLSHCLGSSEYSVTSSQTGKFSVQLWRSRSTGGRGCDAAAGSTPTERRQRMTEHRTSWRSCRW